MGSKTQGYLDIGNTCATVIDRVSATLKIFFNGRRVTYKLCNGYRPRLGTEFFCHSTCMKGRTEAS